MKRKIIIMVSLFIFVTSAFFVKNSFVSKSKSELNPNVKSGLGIPVELIPAEKRGLQKSINYLGTIKADNSVTLSPKITSQIAEVKVKEGDVVKKGDIIARLDSSMLRASLDAAAAKLNTLKISYSYMNEEIEKYHVSNPMVKKVKTLEINYDYLKKEEENYKKLMENGAISQNAYDKVKFEADIKKAQLEEASAASDDAYNKLINQRDTVKMQLNELQANISQININLKDAELISPVSGKVRFVYCSSGDLAVPGKPLAVIDDEKGIVVSVNISEQDMNKIQVGSKALIKITGDDRSIESKVSRILPNINANTRIGEVEVMLPEKYKTEAAAGTSAEVSFIAGEVNEGVIIPKSAVKKLIDKDIVYVVENDTAYERQIKAGLTVGEDIQVVGGISAGEKIAENNLSRLYDGAKVYVLEGEAD